MSPVDTLKQAHRRRKMTSKWKHTPGPWSVKGNTVYFNRIDINPSIGCAYGAGEEVKANAQLIAAAPELLRALDKAYEALQNFTYDDEDRERQRLNVVNTARVAIAKATGADHDN